MKLIIRRRTAEGEQRAEEKLIRWKSRVIQGVVLKEQEIIRTLCRKMN